MQMSHTCTIEDGTKLQTRGNSPLRSASFLYSSTLPRMLWGMASPLSSKRRPPISVTTKHGPHSDATVVWSQI